MDKTSLMAVATVTTTATALDLTPETEELSLTALEFDHDPMWTVNSVCTRHVTANSTWFPNLKPTAGKPITVGENHQFPLGEPVM
ncbi:hypothetical protein PF005_g19524 [Phytophthora fragariae]|uniref:Uncharacterized protein n=1 Tax=Phytophthora fragariae TaxID=53985 RepID=A0A6A3R2E8_9STRA|nr:hypothetical protein PF003_g20836 [Phytophthora fragariae]KAE8928786.1 hypothetical protein PF009_g21081 [Phytophthora fragariae]KAE8989128.1 hypothetical protein PF011_g18895 [Phytophthora fragariae]KAE9087882.1 hypothetical protein PF007_g20197 [Phytophthora fragariae]KAE9090621.1 hypothetical protein PF010_g18513 [Phytophthora fragariae]